MINLAPELDGGRVMMRLSSLARSQSGRHLSGGPWVCICGDFRIANLGLIEGLKEECHSFAKLRVSGLFSP
jgi:hypothetical protein